MSITQIQAQDEITRRAHNKHRTVKVTSTVKEAVAMGGKDLRAIAGDDFVVPPFQESTRKAPAAKVSVGTSAKGRATGIGSRSGTQHTLLRKAAAEVKRAFYRATGENLTSADSQAIFGTAPARSNDPVLAKEPTKKFQAQANRAIKDPDAFCKGFFALLPQGANA